MGVNSKPLPLPLAPIVLFVYNRPKHTRATVSALKRNQLAKESELIIYSDASSSSQDSSGVGETRDYIHTISGFRKISIIKRKNNFGLAKNIISGISAVLKKHDSCIVLEDDMVTSPTFLLFMNSCLNKYRTEQNIWHINGWANPIEYIEGTEYFFWRVMNCWGWATWSNRWKHFEKDPNKLALNWVEETKRHFDINWSGVYWSQIIANLTGRADTWAVFWYATIYQHGGLCLQPTRSFVQNIGLDGSGQNSGSTEEKHSHSIDLNQDETPNWPAKAIESTDQILALEAHYKAQRRKSRYYVRRAIEFILERIYRK